ncbi:polysaccharide export protein [Trichocoleus sp. FACHB-591]|uniref:polysaccharide biosynthesis/export family protein n=1 Tax=Trichocoleus sp. FACHB-591 TaxID=2692872 RepID=UPI001684C686|nr:polysaccharide biosynthesis/export family protein [Trichocoleus sp. FACHB-591]MBD2095669.1 polysaccharide export protein [Trichocoleus sp. FACHB-591]
MVSDTINLVRSCHRLISYSTSILLVFPLFSLLWMSTPAALSQEAEDMEDSYLGVQDLLNPPPESIEAAPPVEFGTYRLDAGDAIAVNIIPRSRDLSFNATLDWAGNVTVPLLGIVSFKGMTLTQAQEMLQQRLTEYLVNPQVGVTLATARPVSVMVSGEVITPGFYVLQDPRIPVALTEAGGTTHLADLRSVQVTRLVSDSTLQQQFDLYTPLIEGNELPDLRLVDGDVITITALAPDTAQDYDRTRVADMNVSQREMTIRVLDYSSGVNRLRLPNGSDFLDALTSIKPNLNDTNLRRVNLIRFDPATNQAVAIELNARDALSGDALQNPPLQHNDVIVINRNAMARFNRFLTQLTQPFQDVLGFLLFFDTAREGINTVTGADEE